MSLVGALDPRFSKRIQQVFGLEAAPLTLDDLTFAISDKVAVGDIEVANLFAGSPTRHEVDFQGEVKHTHCALDALMLPFLTGRDITLRSECPHCGDVVAVKGTRSGFRPSRPKAVLSLGVALEGTGQAQREACPYINLFPSPRHYREWAAVTGGALTIMLSLKEAHRLLRGPGCC
ncbi:MAG: alkylmercury lyase family protein [Chloroflexi bacterium]|nr:alkylmercury lyase family protein [Chloroflexota bacterium]